MIVLVLSMLLLLVLGVPIGYAIGISALVYVALISDMSALVVAQQISSGADTLVVLGRQLPAIKDSFEDWSVDEHDDHDTEPLNAVS